MAFSTSSRGVSGMISSALPGPALRFFGSRKNFFLSGARPSSAYERRRMRLVSRASFSVRETSPGEMGLPTYAVIVRRFWRAVMRGRRTVRRRGCTRPASWKSAGLRPQKCIGTTVAPVLRASAAIVSLHGGSRTRRRLRSIEETSPAGNTPIACPSRSHFTLSRSGRMFSRAAAAEPNGFTKMKSLRISGIAERM